MRHARKRDLILRLSKKRSRFVYVSAEPLVRPQAFGRGIFLKNSSVRADICRRARFQRDARVLISHEPSKSEDKAL